MDLDSRKSEARSELKRMDIQVEVSTAAIRVSHPDYLTVICVRSGGVQSGSDHNKRAEDAGRRVAVGEDEGGSRLVHYTLPPQSSASLINSQGALAVLSLVIIISMEVYVVGPSRAAKKRAEQAQPHFPPQVPLPPTNGDPQASWPTAP